jgi:hypothetical protein
MAELRDHRRGQFTVAYRDRGERFEVSEVLEVSAGATTLVGLRP